MRILITGITGFVGGHLARHLLEARDAELFGLARDRQWTGVADDVASRVAVETIDLLDTAKVEDALRRCQPQHIYHLAGYADTAGSFREPEAAWAGNLGATRSLYDAIRAWAGRPRILYVSSGAVYGEQAGLIREDTELRPDSPYAASKAAADLLSYQCYRADGLEIIRVRPFNHVGPGQSPRYAVSHFARQLAIVERGQVSPVLRTGNLDSERDLTDVRDVVRAYRLLMLHGVAGEAYNLASGVALPVRRHLEILISLATRSVQHEYDPSLRRAADSKKAQVDVSKLRAATGWAPKLSLEQTLQDTLDYWRRAEGG